MWNTLPFLSMLIQRVYESFLTRPLPDFYPSNSQSATLTIKQADILLRRDILLFFVK